MVLRLQLGTRSCCCHPLTGVQHLRPWTTLQLFLGSFGLGWQAMQDIDGLCTTWVPLALQWVTRGPEEMMQPCLIHTSISSLWLGRWMLLAVAHLVSFVAGSLVLRSV